MFEEYGHAQTMEYYDVDGNAGRQEITPKTWKHLINPASYAAGSLFVFIWTILYFINLVGGEQLFGNFIRTFSVDQLKFARDEASYLDTVFWGSFTIGRFLGSLLSHCIKIETLFPLDIIINLIAVTLLDIFSTDSHLALWAFTIVVGLSIAPLYPAAMSYINTQIQVGSIVLIVTIFAIFNIFTVSLITQGHPKTHQDALLYLKDASKYLNLLSFIIFF